MLWIFRIMNFNSLTLSVYQSIIMNFLFKFAYVLFISILGRNIGSSDVSYNPWVMSFHPLLIPGRILSLTPWGGTLSYLSVKHHVTNVYNFSVFRSFGVVLHNVSERTFAITGALEYGALAYSFYYFRGLKGGVWTRFIFSMPYIC